MKTRWLAVVLVLIACVAAAAVPTAAQPLRGNDVRAPAALVEPDIRVEPASLSAEACPGGSDAQALAVCNDGDAPLAWWAAEAEGAQRSPQAVLWDQPPAYSSLTYSSQWHAESMAVFAADDFSNAAEWALDKIHVDGYIVGGWFEDALALHWCLYPDAGGKPAGDPLSGGAYWCWSAGWLDPAVTYGGPYGTDVNLDVAAALGAPLAVPPDHWWLVFYIEYASRWDGSWAWWSAPSANLDNAVFMDPQNMYGGGWTAWTPMSARGIGQWDLGMRLEGTVTGYDVPWLSESPPRGTVPPGECAEVTAAFDAAGLAPGGYSATLLVDSNDPDEPQVAVPVSLTVLEPVHDADFTWSPPDPVAGSPATFQGTAQGSAPIDYTWAFGDGGSAAGNPVQHAYAAPGAYEVEMAAANLCGPQTVQKTVTVAAPPIPMHVAGVSLTLQGTGPWLLTGKGKVHDGSHANLPGVLVQAQWLLPNGTKLFRTFTTGAQGGYQFNLNTPAAGQYRFCVAGLVKAGYTYVKADDHPSPPCRLITLQ